MVSGSEFLMERLTHEAKIERETLGFTFSYIGNMRIAEVVLCVLRIITRSINYGQRGNNNFSLSVLPSKAWFYKPSAP